MSLEPCQRRTAADSSEIVRDSPEGSPVGKQVSLWIGQKVSTEWFDYIICNPDSRKASLAIIKEALLTDA